MLAVKGNQIDQSFLVSRGNGLSLQVVTERERERERERGKGHREGERERKRRVGLAEQARLGGVEL